MFTWNELNNSTYFNTQITSRNNAADQAKGKLLPSYI